LLACARRIPKSDSFVRDGRFVGWAPTLLLGREVYGKTLGIIGMGEIGAAVARRAKGFGMKTIYHNRKRDPEAEKELGAMYVSVDDLLRNSDYVSLHVPLTPETRHLIGEKEFAMMKPTAILLNASRGEVIDEKALIKALKEGRIDSAGLDVYEKEPRLSPGLAELDNVVLTPHTGSATYESRDRMAVMAGENLVAGLRGERPPNLVNASVWKD
jgi:glyoxylate reductase